MLQNQLHSINYQVHISKVANTWQPATLIKRMVEAMRRFASFMVVSAFLACTAAGAATVDSDFKAIEKRFSDWTEAFNRRDLEGSCALFSKDIKADHHGVPTEDWQTMRARFKKLFADKSRQFTYRFKLLRVYRQGNLAVGRITWYLTVTKDGKKILDEETQSMDIFKPNKNGMWEMVDFVSFSEPEKKHAVIP